MPKRKAMYSILDRILDQHLNPETGKPYTPTELSAKADVSRQGLYKYMQGRQKTIRLVDWEYAQKVAAVFGLRWHEIFEIEDIGEGSDN